MPFRPLSCSRQKFVSEPPVRLRKHVMLFELGGYLGGTQDLNIKDPMEMNLLGEVGFIAVETKVK